MGFPFHKSQHIRAKADFERVYAAKINAADGNLLIFADRNGQPRTRIGLSVSKKHGGAVVRNRLKRLLREAFRLQQHQIPSGLDLILIPLAANRASLESYQDGLIKITRRLLRRMETEQPHAGERAP